MSWTERRPFGRSRGNRRGLDLDGLRFPIHIVIGTRRRRPLLADRRLASEVFRLVQEDDSSFVACVLPDHLHWIRCDCVGLTPEMRRFKSLSTHLAWRCGVSGRLWQRSYWDRVIRSEGELWRAIEYVCGQPIRHELVSDAEDWPYLLSEGSGSGQGRFVDLRPTGASAASTMVV